VAVTPEHPVTGKVVFQPFLGVAPRRHHQLFYRKTNPVQRKPAAEIQPWPEVGGRSAASSELAEISALMPLRAATAPAKSCLPSVVAQELSAAESDLQGLPKWLREQVESEPGTRRPTSEDASTVTNGGVSRDRPRP
jgi:hypothetical protein